MSLFCAVILEKQDRFEYRSMKNKRTVGFEYEKIAGEYLEKHGYQNIEYNFYSRHGEIDIIARHEGYLVFVEVKYRKDNKSGHPLEAVSLAKQKTICKCALYYMKMNGIQEAPVRFDVVGILGNKVTLVQNAFEYIQ